MVIDSAFWRQCLYGQEQCLGGLMTSKQNKKQIHASSWLWVEVTSWNAFIFHIHCYSHMSWVREAGRLFGKDPITRHDSFYHHFFLVIEKQFVCILFIYKTTTTKKKEFCNNENVLQIFSSSLFECCSFVYFWPFIYLNLHNGIS